MIAQHVVLQKLLGVCSTIGGWHYALLVGKVLKSVKHLGWVDQQVLVGLR